MRQAKITLTNEQFTFLDQHRALGFRDRSEMVRLALDQFRAATRARALEESAALYAELYRDDEDLRLLTDAASTGWPE